MPIIIGSCKSNDDQYRRRPVEPRSRFIKGDVVYLKPDSLKAVVRAICPCEKQSYTVYYFKPDGNKIQMDVDEELIY